MDTFPLKRLQEAHKTGGKLYHEFLRVDSMSAGLYVLPAGTTDPQHPHQEDEVYYVIGGRSEFTVGAETKPIRAGDTLFVPKKTPHKFHGITEDLQLLVVFAPPEPPKS